MEPASFDGVPGNVLIVEDDPIIALDFEDTILGFGVKAVRTAGNVIKALQMIADQAPDFALLDVGLVTAADAHGRSVRVGLDASHVRRLRAGAIVTKNVPEDTLVVGMPARAIRKIERKIKK